MIDSVVGKDISENKWQIRSKMSPFMCGNVILRHCPRHYFPCHQSRRTVIVSKMSTSPLTFSIIKYADDLNNSKI